MLPFIPKYTFAYLLLLYNIFENARAPGAIQSTAFHYTICKHNLNFYHRSCGTGKTSFEYAFRFVIIYAGQ